MNLWGVINGCRAFLPIMLQQDTEGHVVNTASVAGLVNYHPAAPYQVTKHAVVALSENLYFSLMQITTKVHVSVLCPGWIKTRIMDSERNRPAEFANQTIDRPLSPEEMLIIQSMLQEVEHGLDPAVVAEKVFDAIQQETFYILTEQRFLPGMQERMENIVQQRNPRPFVLQG